MIEKKIISLLVILTVFVGCNADKKVQDVVDGAKELINNKKTVTDASDVNLSDSIQQLLDSHNNARHEVGIYNDMKWSDTIAADAQLYANEMATKGIWGHDTAKNQHDGYGHGNYGENLYTSQANGITLMEASKSWIDEKANYAYGKVGDDSTCQSGKLCGHYTQIIWKNTTFVGCAKSKYKVDMFIAGANFKGGDIIVCKYQTPGNIITQTPY